MHHSQRLQNNIHYVLIQYTVDYEFHWLEIATVDNFYPHFTFHVDLNFNFMTLAHYSFQA